MLSLHKFVTFTFMMICVSFVSACGFQPIYSQQNQMQVAQHMTQIRIANIADRHGQMLRNQLIDKLYGTSTYPTAPKYNLEIRNFSEKIDSVGIKKDATTTRGRITMTGQLILTDFSGKTLLNRKLKAINSYNILEDQYGTLITRQDAQERTIKELASDIETQISLYFASGSK